MKPTTLNLNVIMENDIKPVVEKLKKEGRYNDRKDRMFCGKLIKEIGGLITEDGKVTPFCDALACTMRATQRQAEQGAVTTGRIQSAAKPIEKHKPTEIDRLRARLGEVGICPDCLKEFTHDVDEPFAYCDCATSEWPGELPLLFDLRLKAAAAKVLYQQLLDTIESIESTEEYGDINYHHADAALKTAKEAGL